MSRRRALPLSVLLVLLVGLLAAPAQAASAPASPAAAGKGYSYYTFAGGSMVRALGTTISSDLTAQSVVSGTKLPNGDRSTTARVRVKKLVDLGAIHTQTKVRPKKRGKAVRIDTRAKTADVSLLGGLIRAKAVKTTNVTQGTPRGLKASSRTKFVDIKIAGVHLPVNIPENYRVQIPGVATVVLNASQTAQRNGVVTSQGYALGVSLLKRRGQAKAGTSIILNPTYTVMSVPVPNQHPALGGHAYGTQAKVKVTDAVRGEIGRTAQATTPPNGSGGRVLKNRTVNVDIPGVLDAGVVSSTSKSISKRHRARIVNTNRIAGLNLFNGLIKADAIVARAQSRLKGKRFRHKESLRFVNLVVAGQKIPVRVGKNTRIRVAGLGVVTLNKQTSKDYSNQVQAIHVKLLKPHSGLEAGAVIKVGVAATWIWA